MTTRRARRTVRSAALVALAAAAAFSLTACQIGGDDSAAGPGKKDSAPAEAAARTSTATGAKVRQPVTIPVTRLMVVARMLVPKR